MASASELRAAIWTTNARVDASAPDVPGDEMMSTCRTASSMSLSAHEIKLQLDETPSRLFLRKLWIERKYRFGFLGIKAGC